MDHHTYPKNNLFLSKTNLMTVAGSIFQVSMRCKVWKTKDICSWKKSYSFQKQNSEIFSLTWSQSQCILLIALLVPFRLSLLLSNTKSLSTILNFRKQCLRGMFVQRSTFTMWSGDQKAAKCNTGELWGSMVSVKCGFRLECFSILMFLLTDNVAGFVFSAKNPPKKPNHQTKNKAKWNRCIERRFWFTWSTPSS